MEENRAVSEHSLKGGGCSVFSGVGGEQPREGGRQQGTN